MKKIYKGGFTLIELLIVIAILGVLAVVVLVAINPVQQLARTRDSGRLSTVSQLGHAVEAYYTSRNAETLPEAAWVTALVTAGELNSVPDNPEYSSLAATPGCVAGRGTGEDDGDGESWCYESAANDAVVYTPLEANTNTQIGTCGGTSYAAFSMFDGRGGIVCAPSAAGAAQTWAN